jgi:preprotein translocase subunit YajC
VSFLIVMVLLLVVMYVLMIRPQRQRQRDHQSLIEGAGVGDDILTTGGIYGTITRAEGDDVVVEIGDETKVNVHMTRRGIAAVLPPEDDSAPETIDADAEEEPDDDESGVTTREEAVTSEADAEAAAADRR